MSSSTANLVREVLEEVETGTPFNNSAAYAAEFLPPEKLPAFGGDCISLSRAIQSRLRNSGLFPGTLVERNHGEWHYATVCEFEGELFYLDPNIFAVDPISLSKLFAQPGVDHNVPVFYSATYSRGIIAQVSEDGVFTLSRGRFQDPVYSYHLDSLVESLPSEEKALSNSRSVPRQSFDITTIPSRAEVLRLRYNIGRRVLMVLNNGGIQVKGDADFDSTLSRVSEQLGFPVNELVEILESCADVHNKRHRR